jgi:hypothetical protein
MASIQDMLERKLNIERSIAVANAAREAEQLAINAVLDWWQDAFGTTANVDLNGLRIFVQRLDMEAIRHAVNQTERFLGTRHWMGSSNYRLWKYFCAICWKMIKGDEGESDA